jgi:hypothetical protein
MLFRTFYNRKNEAWLAKKMESENRAAELLAGGDDPHNGEERVLCQRSMNGLLQA